MKQVVAPLSGTLLCGWPADGTLREPVALVVVAFTDRAAVEGAGFSLLLPLGYAVLRVVGRQEGRNGGEASALG